MNSIEWINLVASIFGIVTGIVALVLSIVFFFSAKSAERNTEKAVLELAEATKTISTLSLRMLNKMTEALIAPKDKTEELLDKFLHNQDSRANLSGDQDGVLSSVSKKELEQFRIDNLITAYYYCTITNLAYSSMLPSTIQEVPFSQTIANMVNQTKNDVTIMRAWLDNSDQIQVKLAQSPVRHLYEEASKLSTSVRSIEEFYINKFTPE